MKNEEMNMKALSMDDLETVSGGTTGQLDGSTIAVLELIGDIVDGFSNW